MRVSIRENYYDMKTYYYDYYDQLATFSCLSCCHRLSLTWLYPVYCVGEIYFIIFFEKQYLLCAHTHSFRLLTMYLNVLQTIQVDCQLWPDPSRGRFVVVAFHMSCSLFMTLLMEDLRVRCVQSRLATATVTTVAHLCHATVGALINNL